MIKKVSHRVPYWAFYCLVFFINDIFYFLKHGTLYNYADGNTVSFSTPDFDELIRVLQSESQILLDWFQDNYAGKP